MNYKIINLKKGDILCSKCDDLENFYFVLSGSLIAYAPYSKFKITTGAIAGLTGAYYGMSNFNYIANEDTLIYAYPFKNFTDVSVIFNDFMGHTGKLVSSYNNFVMDLIKVYLALVLKCRKKNPNFTSDESIQRWEMDKYNGLTSIDSALCEQFFSSNTNVAVATLAENARFANILHNGCLKMGELLGLDLDYKPIIVEEEYTQATYIPEVNATNKDDIIFALKNSFNKILSYSSFDEDSKNDFAILMNRFKQCKDKLDSSEETRRLRKMITDSFYELYYNIFLRAANEDKIPAYIRMFLDFGYLDEELAGEDASVYLYALSKDVDKLCNSDKIFTMFNWMKLILNGDKIPSRNTYDQNYDEYIKQEFKSGHLNIQEADALQNSEMKFKFELDNMFRNSHYMTYGKVSTFVPVFLKENISKELSSMLSTTEHINHCMDKIRGIDFTLFYRSVVYSNEPLGISKDFAYIEILPDIILSPCVGTNGVLWQDIEGRSRASASRMIFPFFCSVSLENVMVSTFGKYRWEICKRIQGAYWNVISEKSLTSEFYDYLLFYKKNRDLSDQIKEKIKSTLINCRNNYAEVFIKDYESWILYESRGTSKLNRVSRSIMTRYCPFNAEVRHVLKYNPIFADFMEEYDRHISASKRRIDNICKALNTRNIELPEEIASTKKYFNS